MSYARLITLSLVSSALLARADSPATHASTDPGIEMSSTGRAPIAGGPEREAENPAGVITLKDALSAALLQNPELRAFGWEIRAKEAAILQAGLRINPELSLQVENVRWTEGPRTQTRGLSFTGAQPQIGPSGPSWEYEKQSGTRPGFAEAQFTVVMSKAIELGGKRAMRVRLAQHDKDLAAWDYEVARLNVMKEVTQAFIGVVSGQERVALEEELVKVAQASTETMRKLVGAGQVSTLELSKSETALSLTQIQVEQAREALESARARLAATWGGARAEFERAEGELAGTRPPPLLEDLYARIARNPDLARWADELEQRSAIVAVAKANRIPNVTISAGLRRTGVASRDISRLSFGPGAQWNAARAQIDPDTDVESSLYLGLSVPLPIFNRNQGAVQEAQHRASKASEERRASETRVALSLSRAYNSLKAAYVNGMTLAEKVLPQANRTYDSIVKGHDQGEFSYLDVLDAQRTMFEARNQYLDTLTAYHENIAEIERLAGTSLWPDEAGSAESRSEGTK